MATYISHNVRGLAKYGNRCLSSPEQMLIEKLLLKITTKSYFEFHGLNVMAANGRGLAKYGNCSWSSLEQMLIEKLLLKITTKS